MEILAGILILGIIWVLIQTSKQKKAENEPVLSLRDDEQYKALMKRVIEMNVISGWDSYSANKMVEDAAPKASVHTVCLRAGEWS